VLLGRHLRASRAVDDQEKLIARSPTRVSSVPAATSNTGAIRATLRSCRWLHASKSENRAVHHPADQFHGSPPVRFAVAWSFDNFF
jgi:hypothetical protein